MGLRQKIWARRETLRLKVLLGNKCAKCPAVRDLEFDCIVPQGDKHHKLEWSMRISFYRRQFALNNLQLLCSSCNTVKSCHDRSYWRYQWGIHRALGKAILGNGLPVANKPHILKSRSFLMRNQIATLVVLVLAGAFHNLRSDDAPVISRTWTNKVERIISVVSSDRLQSPCPECGGENHHNVETRMMSAQDHIYTEIVFNARTNTILVGVGVATNWITTNVVFLNSRTQPGWQAMPPPLPPATNHVR